MIKEKKIYIAGAGGMLGSAFYKIFGKNNILRCTDKDVNENWINYLDFRDAENYIEDVMKFKPDYLFHLGALTSLEYCEDNPDDAYLTNTLAVETASHIHRHKIPMLYIYGIFDGNFYDDWDSPAPLGHYARSKFMGERFVTQNVLTISFRAGWMMGGGPSR